MNTYTYKCCDYTVTGCYTGVKTTYNYVPESRRVGLWSWSFTMSVFNRYTFYIK